ncbi:magnesium chelatase subunit H [Prosthecochloris sp. GSB1]|uniref:magnesium chelatase subunit H n=1 Tax=Prosthecochloris sp. GSB1 TaxID=281093 RepID=UPI000B8C96A1|nr:magnesium chelatase subunit H [Prosthecochloris sp. GSB1]ASQ91276.1 magnesium chelatase subunit H [Prosthecochloris sp. GSB1]
MHEKIKIATIVGMEQCNLRVWREVTDKISKHAELTQWTDQDLEHQNPEAAEAIRNADCIFTTLIQFKGQADWLQEQIDQSNVRTIFAYESMPEVMQMTKVGNYVVSGDGSGMPDIVKKVAKMLVKGRDEDALYGYMKLLKIMRTMLPLIPKKAKDFKNWMQVYTYWMHPTAENLASMFNYILAEYFEVGVKADKVVEIPTMGFYHPDAPDYFKDLNHYAKWNKKRDKAAAKKRNIGLIFFRKHLLQEKEYIDNTIRAVEAKGLNPLPVFVMGVEGHVAAREWFMNADIDMLVNMMGFGFVGGPAGATTPGASASARDEILSGINAPYVVSQPLFIQDFTSWKKEGVVPLQSAMTYSLPEMDGAVCPVVLGAVKDGRLQTVPDRLERLSGLAKKFSDLRTSPNSEKKVAFVVYDYPPGMGRKASAALLDVPKSLHRMLRKMQVEGYDVGDLPETPEELLGMLDKATDFDIQAHEPDAFGINRETFNEITSVRERERIEGRWSGFPGDIAPLGTDKLFIGGLTLGNVFIGVQPRLGVQGDPMRLLFDKENTPHHQYIAFYRWISRKFNANALVHVGMHGTVEWMPGLQLGVTGDCWSDALLGETPHFYIYPVNNPSEANIAKRRGYATMISHNIPPLARAGLYKELPAFKDMLNDYRERGLEKIVDIETEEAIIEKAEQLNLTDDCPRIEGENLTDYISRLYTYLMELEGKLISNALHIFGETPPLDSQVTTITEYLKVRGNENSLPSVIMQAIGETAYGDYSALATRARKGEAEALKVRERVDEHTKDFIEKAIFAENANPSAVFKVLTGEAKITQEMAEALNTSLQEGFALRKALQDNSGEMISFLRALNGEYIPSGPGGDIVRDGASILPTGRNMHAIDPWRIPSELAFKRGRQIADTIIRKHQEENGGAYPETIAQVLWGLDTIKSKGEAVAVIINLIGAEPAYDAQGKISHYSLVPLEKLGRPRIDVLIQISSIFRDTFGVLVDLLDKLVKDAAKAIEPEEMNHVRKHVEEAVAKGQDFESATARLFTQAPGSYGSMVEELIEDSAWESEDDLDNMFVKRTSYAYGGNRYGDQQPEILESLLGTVDRVVQQVDSAEYGISDIDRYFSSSGALQLSARKRNQKGGEVKLNYVETFTADVKVDDADKALKVEFRTKLLNPKWFETLLEQGHSGATEISNRFTYMLGWDAVTKGVDDWVYKKAAETYAFDPKMRERLLKANPQAFKNIVGRMLEASGRGMWSADADTIEKLQEIYSDLEDRLEGIEV